MNESPNNAPTVGRPVVLRMRVVPSGWSPEKAYEHYFVSLPAEMVRALGWRHHDRLFPILYPGVGILIQRIRPELPGMDGD